MVGSRSGEATKNLPPEARQRVEGVTQGATGVGADALQTVGGGVKGIVDTAGNTVRQIISNTPPVYHQIKNNH